MRVVISLLYRDASNYKTAGEISLAGPLDTRDVERLSDIASLNGGIIPSAVGFSNLEFEYGAARSEDDHPWHEVTGVRQEEGDPDDLRTFAEFVNECAKIDWVDAAMRWEIDGATDDGDDELGEAA